MNLLTGTISGKLAALKGDIQYSDSTIIEANHQKLIKSELARLKRQAELITDPIARLSWLAAANAKLKAIDYQMFGNTIDSKHFQKWHTGTDAHCVGYEGDYTKSPWEAAAPKKNNAAKPIIRDPIYTEKTKKVKFKIEFEIVVSASKKVAYVGDTTGNIVAAKKIDTDVLEAEWDVTEEINGALYIITYQRRIVNGISKVVAYSVTPVVMQ